MSRQREREPHPDPAIELQLQEILDLRASSDRREALIEQYREEIADLHKDALQRRQRADQDLLRTGGSARREDPRAGGDIEPVHERIRELQGKIGPDDLAFLGSSDA